MTPCTTRSVKCQREIFSRSKIRYRGGTPSSATVTGTHTCPHWFDGRASTTFCAPPSSAMYLTAAPPPLSWVIFLGFRGRCVTQALSRAAADLQELDGGLLWRVALAVVIREGEDPRRSPMKVRRTCLLRVSSCCLPACSKHRTGWCDGLIDCQPFLRTATKVAAELPPTLRSSCCVLHLFLQA